MSARPAQTEERARCEDALAWRALREHFTHQMGGFDLRAAFATDPARFERFSIEAPHVFADLSRNLWDTRARELLVQLADERGVTRRRDAMFAGEPVNETEGRAAGHVWLRSPSPREASAARNREAMLAFAEQVRLDPTITDVVHLGIGGSDLGPRMATQALADPARLGKRLHFVSNVDGHDLQSALADLQPERTLFIVSSKTFTTQETMTNLASARAWFRARGAQDLNRHFVAVTAHAPTARAAGITQCLTFDDWVGGRFSLWSAIGVPLAIAIGSMAFRDLLAGAHAMDEHFRLAPPAVNLPVQLGLLDVWYRNFHGFHSRCVSPYHHGLRALPDYLQQLEMESNGKRVDLDGRPLTLQSSGVVWGQAGTNGQHAFFQMLHQGTEVTPVDFIVTRKPGHHLAGHHPRLLASALAQARTLMVGQEDAGGHRAFPGNRPSTFLVLERLDPRSLGALIALHEHRVFVAGAIWGINSFDQFGVELGKTIARDIQPRLATGDTEGLDPATAGLIHRLRAD